MVTSVPIIIYMKTYTRVEEIACFDDTLHVQLISFQKLIPFPLFKAIVFIELYITLAHIRNSICRDNPKSAYAISSFLPTGYQPTVMITGSHVF